MWMAIFLTAVVCCLLMWICLKGIGTSGGLECVCLLPIAFITFSQKIIEMNDDNNNGELVRKWTTNTSHHHQMSNKVCCLCFSLPVHRWKKRDLIVNVFVVVVVFAHLP